MGVKFSLAHLTVLGCAPPEMTYIAARAGYDFVSPRLIRMGIAVEQNHDYDLSANKQMLRQTRLALASTGIRVHDIELARIHDDVEVTSYVPAMDVGAELGARHLIASVWTTDRNLALERFGELCELAAPFGLTVDLEFVTWSNLVNLRDALSLLRNADRGNTGILIDILHFHRSHGSPEELDNIPREWLHFLHICDAPTEIPNTKEGLVNEGRAERLYVGEGGIDIAAIVNRIPEVPYSIELPHEERCRVLGYAEHAWRCLDSARKYLSAHPRLRKDQVEKQESSTPRDRRMKS
jgi:sugar phosphate isomerase/epimerase